MYVVRITTRRLSAGLWLSHVNGEIQMSGSLSETEKFLKDLRDVFPNRNDPHVQVEFKLLYREDQELHEEYLQERKSLG